MARAGARAMATVWLGLRLMAMARVWLGLGIGLWLGYG